VLAPVTSAIVIVHEFHRALPDDDLNSLGMRSRVRVGESLWSRKVGPILHRLTELRGAGFPQYRDIQPSFSADHTFQVFVPRDRLTRNLTVGHVLVLSLAA